MESTTENKIQEIQGLVTQLNHYRDLYYNQGTSPLSDSEYDALYNRLESLETETKYLLSNSPTRTVGFVTYKRLKSAFHKRPLLSLKKTKKSPVLRAFLSKNPAILMPKADGLTVELLYQRGMLVQASTRGDGHHGEDISSNARVFQNIPLTIPDQSVLRLVGEAVILTHDFIEYNTHNWDTNQTYKTPRNLVAGTVRNTNSSIVKERKVYWKGFDVITGLDGDSKSEKFQQLMDMGFDFLPFIQCDIDITEDQLQSCIERLKREAEQTGLPIDGIVAKYDSYSYSDTLGHTEHHFNDGLAFKFQDDVALTELTNIVWQVGRTGVLSPVAEFNTVDLEGTDVSRALLHNISYIQSLELGIGDSIEVVKSNQIIPQIVNNITRSNNAVIPRRCPECGAVTNIKDNDGVLTLHCSDKSCIGRKIREFAYVFSKDCINVDGLSIATIERLIKEGLINEAIDIYDLPVHRDQLMKWQSFGEKKVNNLFDSIERSKDITLDHFINALCIPDIGKAASKILAQNAGHDYNTFLYQLESEENFSQLNGIGEHANGNIHSWFAANRGMLFNLAHVMRFIKISEHTEIQNHHLNGKSIVITGTFTKFSRKDLEGMLTLLGAAVKSSVSKNTDYLFCGVDAGSKLTKAQELGITIYTEDQVEDVLNGENV